MIRNWLNLLTNAALSGFASFCTLLAGGLISVAFAASLLILSQPASAQEAPFHGTWDCDWHHSLALRILRVCVAQCASFLSEEWTVFPRTWACPDSNNPETLGERLSRCQSLADRNPPLCCPPGTMCSRGAPDDSQTGASGGSDKSRNKALIAGGVVFAGVALWNFVQPPLPEGLTLKPHANAGYSAGFPHSSAGFRGEYGHWAFSASSVNTDGKWSKPYAQVRWSWVF